MIDHGDRHTDTTGSTVDELTVDPAIAPYLRDPPRVSYVEPHDPLLRRLLAAGLERACGRQALEALYQQCKSSSPAPVDFFRTALTTAGIEIVLHGSPLVQVPPSGPVVFIANHPFGIVDGLVLCELARRARGEFRILLHALLCQDRDLASLFLPVDFSGSDIATRTNIRSKQAAERALRAGIPVLIFPAGGVSTRSRFGFGPLADLPWTTFAAKLIARTRATVVPCFFHGENSRLFHVASHIAAPLRLALLLHEVRRRQGQPVHVTVGEPIPFEALDSGLGRAALTEQLHHITWGLGRA